MRDKFNNLRLNVDDNDGKISEGQQIISNRIDVGNEDEDQFNAVANRLPAVVSYDENLYEIKESDDADQIIIDEDILGPTPCQSEEDSPVQLEICQPCIGVRRETISSWERRSPLSPNDVRRLVHSGVRVIIQPSNRRAHSIHDYKKAGAIVDEDLSQASLILSVKQVPVEELLPNKTYVLFSHVIKAQKENMHMLDEVLRQNIRLIDYERMVGLKGERLVAFGKWAGFAGMMNILHGLGMRLLALGHHTPFIHVALAHNYRNSPMARNAVRDVGYEIALGHMPQSIGPLIFVFTGSGNVSQGAQDVFQELPFEYVDIKDLSQVSKFKNLKKVYGCVVSRKDYLFRKSDGHFDSIEYQHHPERYQSRFAELVVPYATVIVNGIYWNHCSPRLISTAEIKKYMVNLKHLSPQIPGCPTLPHRLVAICDISADPDGSIEFMTKCSTIDRPFYIYDFERNLIHAKFNCATGILMCSIDNMPAQMPLEASQCFSGQLMPYIYEMIKSDANSTLDEYHASAVVKNAVIASNGHLTPSYQYIAQLRRHRMSFKLQEMKRRKDSSSTNPTEDFTFEHKKFHSTASTSNE